MSFSDREINDFVCALASRDAVPGGGGASALVGAVGVALAAMVGNLTVGKASYASVEEEAQGIIDEAQSMQQQLLTLIDADAEAFMPLAKAYGIPKDDPTRDAVMEDALKLACTVPLEIMRISAHAIDLHARMGAIGSKLALSDVGVGVLCCKTSLQAASLNVFINTKSMLNRSYARQLETEADALLDTYLLRADEVYLGVVNRLRGTTQVRQ